MTRFWVIFGSKWVFHQKFHNHNIEFSRKLARTLVTTEIHRWDHYEAFEPLWSEVAHPHGPQALKTFVHTGCVSTVPKSGLELRVPRPRMTYQKYPWRMWNLFQHSKVGFRFFTNRDVRHQSHLPHFGLPTKPKSTRREKLRYSCGTHTYNLHRVF